jgi:hypothetical protein
MLAAISLFALAVSLFGLYMAFTLPKETEQQRSIPVLEYRQDGEFRYAVLLKDNSLYDTNEREPGQVYFTQLVDRIRGDFSYSFSSEPSVQEAAFRIRATTSFGSPDLWEREEVLIDTQRMEKEFSIPFDFSMQRYQDLMEVFRQETGVGLNSPQLAVHVRIEPQIETQHGSITEPFEQILTFSFSDQTIQSGDQLEKSQLGSILEVGRESTPGLRRQEATGLKITLGIVAAASLVFLGRLAWWYRPAPSPASEQQRELKMARKRLQGLLIQTDRLPPVEEEEILVRLSSLEELLGLAEEMLRPVMCSANQEGTIYCMIDGLSSMRYEYVSRASDGSKSP